MKSHYLLAPLAVVVVAALSSVWMFPTGEGSWYATLVQPAFAPPDWIFGVVWPILYVCMALALVLFLNHPPKAPQRSNTLWLAVFNGLLNATWGLLFFSGFGWATLSAALICLSALSLAILFWPFSRWASVLLWPYVAWTGFATILSVSFWFLN